MAAEEQFLVIRYIPEAIRVERQLRGWTQKVLAKEAGVAEVQISRVETGAQTPTLGTLDKLLVAFGLAFTDFSRRCMEITELRDPAPQGPRGGPFETAASPLLLDLIHRIGRGTFETEHHVIVVIPKPTLTEPRELGESRASDE